MARSLPDAHQLLSQLTGGEVTVTIGEDRYPPSQPVTSVLLETLALTVELQAGVGSGRTREGLSLARSRVQLQGRPPKLSRSQERHIVGLYRADHDTVRAIGELFNVSRSTVYRAVRRATDRAAYCNAHRNR